MMNVDVKTAKGMREYFKEYVIMGLCVAVITLFGLYYKLNNFIVDTLTDHTSKMEVIIEKNTEAIQLLSFKK